MKRWLILIFLLAFALRFFRLSDFPMGFHADEVRVGWNSYSIMKTGLDDRGNILALYYNTFGDYRPTGIFYLTIPSLFVFGLNEFAVRAPSALLGALTVFPIYYLVLEIDKKRVKAAYWSAFFLAIIPWHWIVSRATSEAIMSVFFALYGLVFFLRALSSNKSREFIWSILTFVVSIFLYHSSRPLAPVFLTVALYIHWNDIKPQVRKNALITTVAISCLVAFLLLGKGSLGRFSQVSLFKSLETNQVLGAHTEKETLIARFRDEYSQYLGFDFLLGDSPKPYRYRVYGVSLVGLPIVIFFLTGVIAIVRKKRPALPLFLFAVAPLPAALTMEDAPNLHRALFMIPFLVTVAGFGVGYLIESGLRGKLLVTTLTLCIVITTVFTLRAYYVTGAQDSLPYRNYGASEVAKLVLNEGDAYKNVILTNDPDSIYPWYAFYGKVDPASFNKEAITRKDGPWSYKNIRFTQSKCPSSGIEWEKGESDNVLVVDGLQCEAGENVKKIPNLTIQELSIGKQIFYRIWRRN